MFSKFRFVATQARAVSASGTKCTASRAVKTWPRARLMGPRRHFIDNLTKHHYLQAKFTLGK